MGSRFGLPGVIYKRDITDAFRLSMSENRAVPRGLFLLERMAETGSLRDAANAVGLDEDLAWNYLVAANNLSDVPLIRPLAENLAPTLHAKRLLGRSEDLERAFQRFLDAPAGGAFRQFDLRQRILRRIGARTSARNQFYCRVRAVRRERINAVVMLDLGGGDRLDAQISACSAEDLGLVAGQACHALIDPAWIEVQPDRAADCDKQQNCLRGRVLRCLIDPVDAEVAIELGSGRIVVANMTQAEMAEKDIQVGRSALAVVQSSQIILAVDATESP
jgi:molybdate transport system regulatory protein